MSADDFVHNVTDALFVLIFAAVLARTLRAPRRANVDAALLFGAVAVIVVESWVSAAARSAAPGVVTVGVLSLLMALPYFLLRLVDDYVGVSARVMSGVAVGLVLSVLAVAAARGHHLPLPVTLLLVSYFAVVSGYVVAAVIRAARHASGVTQQRMNAVALGTACLGLVIVLAGLRAVFPGAPRSAWSIVTDVVSLGTGLSFFIAFVPPNWLRRTWQEPALRAFLGRAASLPRLPDTGSIVVELERGAGRSLGTQHAVIGLWNPSAGALEFEFQEAENRAPLVDSVARVAFSKQEPVFSADATAEYPEDAETYRRFGVNSALAVPITVGDQKLGVLSVYAPRAPIFAEDDLELIRLLADQAAVILESRALIDEAARVQAREEATRLKDDFLSAAAHDLKTPLTAVIAQAQLLERRARRKPDEPPDLQGIERIVREAQRLRHLVTELLDVGRVEQGKILDRQTEVDLVELVRRSCERHSTGQHVCAFETDAPVTGTYDEVRIGQLVDNLLENAVKYSPDGGTIDVRLRLTDDTAYLSVSDRGIGIPAGDVEHLFDRFHRGSNVDDRRFSGMGLGLFICKAIAEQHGGRLWATSDGPGQGSTFHLVLPVLPHALVENRGDEDRLVQSTAS